MAGRPHGYDSVERPPIGAHRSPMRERPGSLAVPPFGAAERLIVPGASLPLGRVPAAPAMPPLPSFSRRPSTGAIGHKETVVEGPQIS